MTDNEYAKKLLVKASKVFDQSKLSELLGKDPRTIRRWLGGEPSSVQVLIPALEKILSMNKKESTMSQDFSFIDLFAGIGGIRTGFENNGGHCVFTSEWDSYCQKTYGANFNVEHEIVGDINNVMHDIENLVPKHDVLLAGFPCQPFSIAGVSKKNSLGRVHGFACQEQGNLFFKVADILETKRPPAFLLENVKNLMSHDKGKTFKIIKDTLVDVLGYKIFPLVVDGKGFVPQHRERIYIVGFDGETDFSWDDFNAPASDARKMKHILHPQDGSEKIEDPYTVKPNGLVNEKYTLSDKLWNYLQGYAAKHKAAGNGFGFGLVGPEDTSRTLSARYYKDGSEILVSQGENKNPRRLTPRECARLMGFNENFKIPVSDTRAYKQFGNCVVVPVIEEIARIMKPHIMELKANKKQEEAEEELEAVNG